MTDVRRRGELVELLGKLLVGEAPRALLSNGGTERLDTKA